MLKNGWRYSKRPANVYIYDCPKLTENVQKYWKYLKGENSQKSKSVQKWLKMSWNDQKFRKWPQISENAEMFRKNENTKIRLNIWKCP